MLALANTCAIGTKRSIVGCRIGSVAHNGRRRYVPTCKGIVVHRIRRLSGCTACVGGRRAVIPLTALQRGAVIIQESDGILVHRPLGVVGFCARCSGTNRSHSRTAEIGIFIPAAKGITGLGYVAGQSCSSAVCI